MYYSIIITVVLLIILTSFQYSFNKIIKLLEEININLKSLKGKF
ncbi:MAG: hypothetical protein U9Q80_02465 [Bacillota bacterium]|nr:hypothetical protein [Bacillota bacterium]